MNVRAAVAVEAKNTLEIVEPGLFGPRSGKVVIEIMATSICRTDVGQNVRSGLVF